MPMPDEPAGKTSSLPLLYSRHAMKVARGEVVVIFLALIRTLTSCYQLKTRAGNMLPAGQVGPIITGSLVAALFCLALILLYFFGRHQGHARGFRAGHHFASARKDLPVRRITQAGQVAKCPRHATGIAEGTARG